MATYKYGSSVRMYTASADQICGAIVLSTDGLAGYVEAQRGIKNGETGRICVEGTVTMDKASGVSLAAGARVQMDTTTLLVTAKASGAADAGNILVGRVVTAAGSGTTSVDVDLNRCAV